MNKFRILSVAVLVIMFVLLSGGNALMAEKHKRCVVVECSPQSQSQDCGPQAQSKDCCPQGQSANDCKVDTKSTDCCPGGRPVSPNCCPAQKAGDKGSIKPPASKKPGA